MRLKTKIAGAALSVALIAAAPAYGQSAAQDGYSQPAGQVQQQLEQRSNEGHRVVPAATNESTPTSSDSKLPFTGLDIALVIAAGGVLLAMGLGIRRLSRAEVA
jgi:hypothetical protein